MQRRALVVGVSQYSKVSLGNFVSFANNANEIADILEPTFKVKRLPEAVDGDRVRVGKSTVNWDLLQNELKELFTATDLEVVLFYFSGHGLKGKQLFPRTYLAASDSEGLDDGYRRAFEIEDLKRLLKDCPAREQIVWLDCCYGGDLANFREVCDRNDGKTRFIITASRSQDPAYQEIAGEMGVFTRVLVSALSRTGATERRITCAAIEDAVREKLQNLQYPQMPQFYRTPNKIIEFWDRRIRLQENQDDVKQDNSEVSNVRIVQKALENVSAGGNIHVSIIQNADFRGDEFCEREEIAIAKKYTEEKLELCQIPDEQKRPQDNSYDKFNQTENYAKNLREFFEVQYDSYFKQIDGNENLVKINLIFSKTSGFYSDFSYLGNKDNPFWGHFESCEIKEILDSQQKSNHRQFIFGEHASGKTTTMLQIARSRLQIARSSSKELVTPIFFHLSKWNNPKYKKLSFTLSSEKM